ncbi:MAG: CapA family protein [Bacillota bacterium]
MRRVYLIITALILVGLFFMLGTKAGNDYSPENLINLAGTFVSDLTNLDSEYSDQDVEDQQKESEPVEVEEETKVPEPDQRSVSMSVAGDITAHVPQIEQAHLGEGEYDFTPSFEVIAPYLQEADIAVGDLETSQAGSDITFWGYSGYTGYPLFNAPQELSEALVDAGFDALTLANNHTLDRGYEGLKETLSHVRELGIETFGASKSWEERNNPLMLERNGVKIAFIGYTYGLNGIPVPEGHEYCVNQTANFDDITPIIEDIDTARANGADIVAIFPHWGEMYVTEPQPQRLRQVAEKLAAAGADLILGGHPHTLQPIEWFFNEEADGTERATLAIYSLGNFISNQHYPHNPTPYVEYGILLDIDLTKSMNSGETWISDVDYEIIWVHRNWRHRILPLSEVLEGSPEEYNLNQERVEELRVWYQNNSEVVEKYDYLEDKEKTMEISDHLYEKTYENYQQGGNSN